MTPQQFIKDRIDSLVIAYPNIQCSYEYDSSESSHIIEVSPASFYEQDKSFTKDEGEILTDFFNLFPYEGIYFITESSVAKITNPIYVRTGNHFGVQKSRYCDLNSYKQQPFVNPIGKFTYGNNYSLEAA